MKLTEVVNLKYDKCDIKICRCKDNSIPEPPLEGCFGNPFFLRNPNDDNERTHVIYKYKQYFLNRIEIDYKFREAVLSLKGKKLGCFCAPKPCHGDIIIQWLDNLSTNHIHIFNDDKVCWCGLTERDYNYANI